MLVLLSSPFSFSFLLCAFFFSFAGCCRVNVLLPLSLFSKLFSVLTLPLGCLRHYFPCLTSCQLLTCDSHGPHHSPFRVVSSLLFLFWTLAHYFPRRQWPLPHWWKLCPYFNVQAKHYLSQMLLPPPELNSMQPLFIEQLLCARNCVIGEVIQLDKIDSMRLSKEKIFKKWYLIWD